MKHRQKGAALLMAMLTVTLVATFAAASLWQQWRSVEVETAERSRVQSSWVLTGALDWARLILREDARSAKDQNIDHLGEPWAVALQESRLSTFLAADRNNTADAEDDVDAFLSGQIIDLQSRLNVLNLWDGAKVSEVYYKAFARLFEQLNLPPQELSVMAENLRLAGQAGVLSVGIQAPASSAGANTDAPLPLVPPRAEQLGWLGLSPATVAALQPFVTVLPIAASAVIKVNLNTASVEVLQACIEGIGRSDAQRLVAARARNPFRTLSDVTAVLGRDTALVNETQHGVNSSFFEVQGRLRIGANMVVERSLVQRIGTGNGTTVTTLWRERSAADPAAMALAATR